MCGIAGVFGSSDNVEPLQSMLEKLSHRGPDDEGVYHSGVASFAHARLSIIDIAEGKQPIFNEDQTLCIVFNGEIYNYRELRESLAERHEFLTDTDTEVILHLYEELGDECVGKLDGMFAFAIYDADDNLFLARDPLGIKPLYVSHQADDLYFASEMKALTGNVTDIEEFPAGHCYHSERGLKRYFSIPRDCVCDLTPAEAKKEIRRLLERAVEKRLMSDVPLGVFLSGGLDSSIIAAIAGREVSNLNTFSVGMPDGEDLQYSQLAAEYLETRHQSYTYTFDEMLSALPEIIYHLESYDAALVRSAIPNYFLARLASRHVKVALSGEGADELFGGYHYLKEFDEDDLHDELVDITEGLSNTNLQRVDRMTMAHGIEGRVPFLDIDLLRYAFRMPVHLKTTCGKPEKWILREAFKEYLPDEIVYRTKEKFSAGCGSANAMADLAENEITDWDFERSQILPDGRRLKNKEELMYYRIFRGWYGDKSAHSLVGASRSL